MSIHRLRRSPRDAEKRRDSGSVDHAADHNQIVAAIQELDSRVDAVVFSLTMRLMLLRLRRRLLCLRTLLPLPLSRRLVRRVRQRLRRGMLLRLLVRRRVRRLRRGVFCCCRSRVSERCRVVCGDGYDAGRDCDDSGWVGDYGASQCWGVCWGSGGGG
jgi:hypothetical protein